MRSMLK